MCKNLQGKIQKFSKTFEATIENEAVAIFGTIKSYPKRKPPKFIDSQIHKFTDVGLPTSPSSFGALTMNRESVNP